MLPKTRFSILVREALNDGATWIIAGKGTPPGILTDWSVLTLKADDDRSKKEPETEVKNLSDASDNREPEIEKSAQSAMEHAEDENSIENRSNCMDQTHCGPSTEQAKFYLKLINACKKIPANESGFIPIPTLRRFVEDDQFESLLLDIHESGDVCLHPPENELEISDEESCLCPPTPDGKFYYFVDMMLKDSL